MLEKFFAEVFGTAILILLGDGVVAGVLLAKTKVNALSGGSAGRLADTLPPPAGSS